MPPSPDRPGTQIRVKNPNPAKWEVYRQTAQPGQARQQGAPIAFVCKPLACSGRAVLVAQSTPSPTREPDRAALEKAAKLLPTQTRAQDLMMEAVSEGDERIASLGSKVTEIRGYPAIMAETKRTTRGEVSYAVRGDLFIGFALVKVMSVSTDRAEAKRNFDAFVEALDIIDFAPGGGGGGSSPGAVALGEGAGPQ